MATIPADLNTQPEGTSSTIWQRLAAAGLAVAIVAMIGTQVYQQYYRFSGGNVTRIHMALAGSIVILGFLARQRRSGRFLAHAVMLVAFLAAMYYFLRLWVTFGPAWFGRPGTPEQVSWVFTSILISCVLFYAYRSFGLSFTVLGLIFIVYVFYAHLFPGTLHGLKNPAYWNFRRLSRSMFGDPFDLAAEFMWLLLFWGQMLTAVGAGPAITWLSQKLARSTAGGPALGTVVSSAVVGSFTGAGAQGVAITGPITIPAMRRAGYKAEAAAAVEAVAANGAAITPPVLGTVAFIMANVLNMSYVLIVIMTLVPALLWYVTTGVYLVGHARVHGLTGGQARAGDAEPGPGAWLLVRSAAIGIVPIIVLIYLVAVNTRIEKAVWYAVVATAILAATLRVETRLRFVLATAKEAAVAASGVSLTLAILALVTSVMLFTGLGLRLSSLVEDASGGVALAGLAIMVITGTFLAGPLPPTATYLIMAVTFAPVLARMGVPYVASHFVAFYIGSLGTIVPPIAQSTLMASVIAGTNYMRTNWEVLKIAWPLFILPIVFIAAPELLLVAGGPTGLGVISASIALAILLHVYAALATVGWLFVPMAPLIRLPTALVPPLAFAALYNDSALFGIAACVLAGTIFAWQWWEYLAIARSRGLDPFADGAIAGVPVATMRTLGYGALGLTAFFGFAWIVLVYSPLAPGKLFRFTQGIEGINDALGHAFLIGVAASTTVGLVLLLLARVRTPRPKPAAAGGTPVEKTPVGEHTAPDVDR